MKRGSTELYQLLRGLKKQQILRLSKQTCRHGHSLIVHPTCLRNELGKEERIGFVDIEASNLSATFGYIISYCIKEADGKIFKRVLTPEEINNHTFDKELIRQFISDARQFDRLLGYYSTKFDIPFLRTRAIYWEFLFPLFAEIKHTDVYYIVRNKLNLHRNRLETACEFFSIPCKGHRLNPSIWQRAMSGEKKALNYILEHNKEDVISLEQLYNKVNLYVQINNRSI